MKLWCAALVILVLSAIPFVVGLEVGVRHAPHPHKTAKGWKIDLPRCGQVSDLEYSSPSPSSPITITCESVQDDESSITGGPDAKLVKP